ncbi:MAG: type II toxin-antitoxin system RelE/ParE family toxin [Saccharofermentanales bacterium]
MASHYDLKVTYLAQEDLNEIFFCISENLKAPAAAKSLMEAIIDGIQSLCNFPYKSPESTDLILKHRGYRKLVIENYIALYLVDENSRQITIARVFYGAMDYGKYI